MGTHAGTEIRALPVAAPVSRRPVDEPAVVRSAWKLFEEDL
ncbi:hypothetical protein ACQP08_03400 [Micromonospora zamorensis]|nr:hypothetical protein [Micromonospora sp. WMMD961]MDG4778972.1 hypothetical protein [Micromonospora sp. WMMD961]